MTRFTVLAAMLAGFTGCQAPDTKTGWLSPIAALDRHIPWRAEEEPGLPGRIEGNWIDAVLHQQGQIPQRGFGGRLYFYPDRGEEPILVDGELAIYAFAEDGRNPTDNRPTRKYVYPSDVLAEQVVESEMGKSYNVWIPWDEIGGPQTRVSLMCRFQPQVGPAIVGEQSTLVLAGPGGIEHAPISETPASPAAPDRSAVEQAVYQAPGPAAANAVQPAGYLSSAPTGGAGTAAGSGWPEAARPGAPQHIAPTTIPLPRDFPIRRPAAGESVVITPTQPASRIAMPVPNVTGAPIDAGGEITSATVGSAVRWPTMAGGLSQYNVTARTGAVPAQPVPQVQMPPIQVGGAGDQAISPLQPPVQQPAAEQPPGRAQQPRPSNGGWSTFGSPRPTPNVPPGVRYTTVNGQLVGP